MSHDDLEAVYAVLISGVPQSMPDVAKRAGVPLAVGRSCLLKLKRQHRAVVEQKGWHSMWQQANGATTTPPPRKTRGDVARCKGLADQFIEMVEAEPGKKGPEYLRKLGVSKSRRQTIYSHVRQSPRVEMRGAGPVARWYSTMSGEHPHPAPPEARSPAVDDGVIWRDSGLGQVGPKQEADQKQPVDPVAPSSGKSGEGIPPSATGATVPQEQERKVALCIQALGVALVQLGQAMNDRIECQNV